MCLKKVLYIVPLLVVMAFSQSAFAKELIAEAEAVVDVERNGKLCEYTPAAQPEFSSAFIAKDASLKVETGEPFEVKVFVKNTGNTPWFSVSSGCSEPTVSLSTDKLPNRPSAIYLESGANWESMRSIGLDQGRVDPGEVGSFTFTGQYDDDDIIKEYFVPVVHGVKRLDEAAFALDLIVGDHDWSIPDMRKKLLYATLSGSTSHINPQGDKRLRVDLSDQTVTLELDGVPIRVFQASTGAPGTPTPVGNTEISLKQELRVGGKWPHYHMPNFMWFRAGGYGFHSLPYLVNDSGTFWSEAWDHIGIPVSHGCVRMLPDDSDFAFAFADIGTAVTVQY